VPVAESNALRSFRPVIRAVDTHVFEVWIELKSGKMVGDWENEENGGKFAQVRVDHVGGGMCWGCTVIYLVPDAILRHFAFIRPLFSRQ
jgi:hypothetical protein